MKFTVAQRISNEIKVDKNYVLHEISKRLADQITKEVISDDSCLTRRNVDANQTTELYTVYVFSFQQLRDLLNHNISNHIRNLPTIF